MTKRIAGGQRSWKWNTCAWLERPALPRAGRPLAPGTSAASMTPVEPRYSCRGWMVPAEAGAGVVSITTAAPPI